MFLGRQLWQQHIIFAASQRYISSFMSVPDSDLTYSFCCHMTPACLWHVNLAAISFSNSGDLFAQTFSYFNAKLLSVELQRKLGFQLWFYLFFCQPVLTCIFLLLDFEFAMSLFFYMLLIFMALINPKLYAINCTIKMIFNQNCKS